MNTVSTQDLARLAKIRLLQWKIERTRSQLDKCQSCTPEGRKLMLKLVTLVQQRNSLHTASEVAAMEKNRGLA